MGNVIDYRDVKKKKLQLLVYDNTNEKLKKQYRILNAWYCNDDRNYDDLGFLK